MKLLELILDFEAVMGSLAWRIRPIGDYITDGSFSFDRNGDALDD